MYLTIAVEAVCLLKTHKNSTQELSILRMNSKPKMYEFLDRTPLKAHWFLHAARHICCCCMGHFVMYVYFM